MDKAVVKFSIFNKQEDYANCFQFIECVKKKKESSVIAAELDKNFLKNIEIYDKELPRTIQWEWINQSGIQYLGYTGDLTVIEDLKYIFLVECSDENDMINLIYYALIADNFSNQSILVLKTKNYGKWKANIRDLFYELLYENKISDPYILNENNVLQRVDLKSTAKRNVKKFSPIFEIAEEKESAAYWRQSVHSVLLMLYRTLQIGGIGYSYGENYFLPHIYPQMLLRRSESGIKRKKLQANMRLQSKEYNLFSVFVDYFCGNVQGNSVKVSEERYEIWKTREFYEEIRDIPFLAMYIFCTFDYFSDVIQMEIKEIKEKIFIARDMADGLLQIIENVYHSENKRGYFCLRIHSDDLTDREKRNKYLQENYREYMNARGEKGDARQNYLEVKIIDYSKKTIPNMFRSNFDKRKKNAVNIDKIAYQKIAQEVSEVNVKTFFEANKFWEKYNAISENIVHHYGLQVFDSFISCYNGYFRVRSQEKYRLENSAEMYCSIEEYPEKYKMQGIPGTQYEIVVPFHTQPEKKNTVLNVNVNYTDTLSKKFQIIQSIVFNEKQVKTIFLELPVNLSYQEKKEQTISELKKIFSNKIKKEYQGKGKIVIHCRASEIPITYIEFFCKTIMLYIAQERAKQECYIMITDCRMSHFVEITRLFALFYDKNGKNPLMQKVQIYMSGNKEYEEFLISGATLEEVIQRTEKLSFARGVHPECLKILKKMIKNREKGKPKNKVEIVPFDMLEYGDTRGTVFQQNVNRVLDTDIRSAEFGCKLESLHARVGNAIHIDTFYEAELLFHNNYYTSRFAFWLKNQLEKNKKIDKNKSLILIGYENYSEMLLYEVKKMYEQEKCKVNYLIYEQRTEEKLREEQVINDYFDAQFVLIVPINTTTTTHDKLQSYLKSFILKRDKNYDVNIVGYYGIVLVADKGAVFNEYWIENEKSEEKSIVSKIFNEEIFYFTKIETEWFQALNCKKCFPAKGILNEEPLVETNKESIVPMLALDFRKVKKKMDTSFTESEKEEITKLKLLSQYLIYHHIERNSNHFQFYFATEKIMNNPLIRKNIQTWLRKYRNKEAHVKEYDIIVAPLHYSNAAFVEEVNKEFFGNAALVLHFEVEKEFRKNIQVKYSNIDQLYQNLHGDEEKSHINFHYVDDTIVSGKTYMRASSLVNCLIKQQKQSNVTVNCFATVILLINRLSEASKQDYIKDTQKFYAYFNLQVSSMRNHEDACFLCKKNNNARLLAQNASFNESCYYWNKKAEDNRCITSEQNLEEVELKNGNATKRMISTHKAQILVNKICETHTADELICEIIDKLFYEEKVRVEFEELISYFKVLSRPFLNFKIEVRTAIFKLTLETLDALLRGNVSNSKLDLNDVLQNETKRYQMIQVLLSAVVEMGSTYLIRKEQMDRILLYAKTNENQREEFLQYYRQRIKQLVEQSSDSVKSLYLEYLLLYNCEYPKEEEVIQLVQGDSFEKEFMRTVFVENTKILEFAIAQLARCVKEGELRGSNDEFTKEKLEDLLNTNYYFDNFILYLGFHKKVLSDNGKISKFCNEESAKQIIEMVKLQCQYEQIVVKEEKGKEVKYLEEGFTDEYKKMLTSIKKISSANEVKLIVACNVEDKKGNSIKEYRYLHIDLESNNARASIDEYEEDVNEELLGYVTGNKLLELNTYAFIEKSRDIKWLVIKYCDIEVKQQASISEIFLQIELQNRDHFQTLDALKNILLFRQKTWKLLNLSSNTLLKNWIDELYYKQQMLKSRASSHEGERELENRLEKLASSQINDIEKIKRDYLELAVNSMIGRLNAKALGGVATKFFDRTKDEFSFASFWVAHQNIFKMVEAMWKLRLLNTQFIEFFSGASEEKTWELGLSILDENIGRPNANQIFALILAIFQSASRHGEKGEDDIVEIFIYKEVKNICFANYIDEKKQEEVKKRQKQITYRKQLGISEAVIADFCDAWYGRGENEYFCLEEKEIGNTKKIMYIVKLPILMEEENENKNFIDRR